jgi:multidrug efflux pump subunit AcrB
VDLRIQQSFNQPELHVTTDRSRAQELGLSQRDIASNLLLTLAGSGQLSPTFWLDPKTGVQYSIVTQAPQYRMDSLDDLQNVPVSGPGQMQVLAGLATITRGFGQGIVTHFNTQPVIDIFGAVQDRDLGAVGRDVRKILAAEEAKLPKGTQLVARGQMQTMTDSYTGLAVGLVGAILLIYLLIVVNFQSWLDPFIIITALPAAIAGIAWTLLLTGTTLSVPALTGAIMCMGVATANSILLVTFARTRMNEGERRAGGARRRVHAFPPGDHDGPRVDHRHAPMALAWQAVSRTLRSAARSSVTPVRNGCDAVCRADRLRGTATADVKVPAAGDGRAVPPIESQWTCDIRPNSSAVAALHAVELSLQS